MAIQLGIGNSPQVSPRIGLKLKKNPSNHNKLFSIFMEFSSSFLIKWMMNETESHLLFFT